MPVQLPAPGRRRRLSEAVALVPEIARQAGHEFAPQARVIRAELTSTGMAVVVLAASRGGARTVVKIPTTSEAAAAIERESERLAALHADERLGDLRRLIPRPLATGVARGRAYRLDGALRGTGVDERIADERARARLLEAAAETIHLLHSRSTHSVEGDRVVGAWLDARAEHAAAHGVVDPARMSALFDRLRSALARRTLAVGWVHGDYWTGNLLFEGQEPTGILDWDASDPADLPAIDLLHLLLYTRRLAGAGELGEIVARQLRLGEWTPLERGLLMRYAGWADAIPPGDALLLYWLRHVAHHERLESAPGGIRHRLWARRNVRPVLAALAA